MRFPNLGTGIFVSSFAPVENQVLAGPLRAEGKNTCEHTFILDDKILRRWVIADGFLPAIRPLLACQRPWLCFHGDRQAATPMREALNCNCGEKRC